MHKFFSRLKASPPPAFPAQMPEIDRRDRHAILMEAVGLFQNSVEGRIEFAKEVAAAAQIQFGHHRDAMLSFAAAVQVRNV